MQSEFIENIEILSETHDNNIDALMKFVDTLGVCNGLSQKTELTSSEIFKDFTMFIITKSLKTFGASNTLIINEFPQDSLVLLRSVYENFLVLSYLIKNPSEIDEIVIKRLGFSKGLFKQFLNTKGKPVRGKYVDIKTEEIFKYGTSISKIAKNGKYEIDGEIHNDLYRFLSEFIHPNMICSTGYMDFEKKSFTYQNSDNYIIPMWISVYLQTILLHEIHDFFILGSKMEELFEAVCSDSIAELITFLRYLSTLSEENKSALVLFKERLNMIIH